MTASLNVTGYADAPKITLSSNPPMPQDEVLARLIFGTGITQLSPFQVAEIGFALISLTGAGPGIDPVGTMRKRLGLDRLAITGAGSQGTSVEAGRYVARRVYIGARQSTNGVSQGLLQVDLTRRLKLTAAIGNGSTTAQGVTPENDPGDSVGLTYQFEY